MCADVAQSGTPTLLLDVRERAPLSAKGNDRNELIELAKRSICNEDLTYMVDALVEAVFAISLSLSVIQTFDSLLNAKSRWRQLRASATALESMIWCYRTRVGAFELEDALREGLPPPEAALMDGIKHFREELIGAANLGVSDFRKRHPPSVYKHFQDAGGPKADADDFHDDYQSPVQPHRYIALRIKPVMSQHRRKL